MDWITIIATVICALLFLSFVWKNSRSQLTIMLKKENNKSVLDTQPRSRSINGGSVCRSPTCVRCQSQAYDAISIKSKLIKSFKMYIVDDQDSSTSEFMAENKKCRVTQKLTRILCTINSIDNKAEILQEVYHESGYKFEPKWLTHPHIWWMPNLKRSPFWEAGDHSDLERITSLFESQTTIELLQNEYKSACNKPLLWKENDIPSGKWRLFIFYNQGSKVVNTCEVCPNTLRLLESLCGFMTCCVYGIAMISVLESGSQIEAHTGPCNFRLRCHLALFETKNYMIQVGNEMRSWEKGKLMIFDDSFVHRVWHEHEVSEENDADDRVVLIFDIWHPDVDGDERQALNFIFPSN